MGIRVVTVWNVGSILLPGGSWQGGCSVLPELLVASPEHLGQSKGLLGPRARTRMKLQRDGHSQQEGVMMGQDTNPGIK